MGEVYRATDTRLDRTVAIKVLPEHLADDPQRRERFEREARAVSSLNHPHICTLHDIGEQDGVHFLVMEYVEGDTLQQRLEKGRLPLDQALEYAIQIADALDKAYRQGVVHRDLKPGNIMLTKSGTKLLDFGLAKLRPVPDHPHSLSQAPTESGTPQSGGGEVAGEEPAWWMHSDHQSTLTAEGTILGTLQYMAPEQLEGKEADARTDIFAFGAVVYEMVTGKKAFEGASQASLIGAILKDTPKLLSELQPVSPSTLDRTVRKCLAKDPDDRWQTARDLLDELKWLTSTASSEPATTETPSPGRERVAWGLFAAAAIVVVVLLSIIAALSIRPEDDPSKQIVRSELVLPIKDVLGNDTGSGSTIVISPDGSHVVYSGYAQGARLLPLSNLKAQASLLGGALVAPIFSADGQWLLYESWSIGRMNRIPINGGAPSRVADTLYVGGATWGSDDTIVFSPDQTSSLWVVSEGGEAQPLTTLADDEESHRWPALLPDNRAVLFTVRKKSQRVDDDQIAVYSFDDESTRVLFPGANPHYSPTGHLVYARGNSLFAVRFDPVTLEVGPTHVGVVEDVLRSQYGGAQFSFSDTGTLVYVPADTPEPENRLVWVDRDGKAEAVIGAEPRHYGPAPRLSPDGKKIAFSVDSHFGWGQDISIHDVGTGLSSQLTFSGNSELAALPALDPGQR